MAPPSPELGPKQPQPRDDRTEDVVDAVRVSAQDILNNNIIVGPPNNNNNTTNVTSTTSNSSSLPSPASSTSDQQHPANNELQNIGSFTDVQLKALLDEAITYKTPKDRENKSETFKELLKRAENEEKSLESNLSCMQYKASGGGSLQNIFESANSDYLKKSSAISSRHSHGRAHGHNYTSHIVTNNHIYHGHFHGGGSGTGGLNTGSGTSAGVSAGVGIMVGGSHHHHGHHSSGAGGHRGNVSSRQREGGSLPSNVNSNSWEPTFISEHKRRSNNNSGNLNHNCINSSGKSVVDSSAKNEETTHNSESNALINASNLVSTGGEVATLKEKSAASNAMSVNAEAGDAFATAPVWSSDKNQSVIINICDYRETEPEFAALKKSNSREVVAECSTRSVVESSYKRIPPTTCIIPRATLQQQYRTNVKIDIESSNSVPAAASTAQLASINSVPSAAGNRELGAAGKQLQPSSEHVDKGLNLNLESKTEPIFSMQLSSNYEAVKGLIDNGEKGYKMFMAPPASSHLEETYRVINPTQSASVIPQGGSGGNLNSATAKDKKKKLSKHDRNTTTMESDKIVGFRGDEEDVDRLVQFIESKENTDGSREAFKKGKRDKNSSKKDNNNSHQNSGGKLKKSNSMNELRSCSKLDEIVRTQEEGGGGGSHHEGGTVALRAKNKNKNQSNNANNISSTVEPKNSSGNGNSGNGNAKRGDRRSWGTEELSYLGDNEGIMVDSNNNSGNVHKRKEKEVIGVAVDKKEAKGKENSKAAEHKMAEETIKAKTLTEMAINSISMDSVLSSSWTNEMAEFHVVTKKRKSKKKQNIVVQPFDVDPSRHFHNTGNHNRRNMLQNNNHDNHQRLRGGSSSTSNVQSNSSRPNANPNSISNSRHGQQASGISSQNSQMHQSQNAVNQKSRRKSTSSMPPSDKSDCSDLDSVHSLPIDSPSSVEKSKRQQNTEIKTSSTASNNSVPQISYADIARIAKREETVQKMSVTGNGTEIKWPTIGKDRQDDKNNNNSSVNGKEENVTDMEHNDNNNNPKSAIAIEVVGSRKELEAAQKQKMSDIIKSGNTELLNKDHPISKNVLHKSKSMDNEPAMVAATAEMVVFNMSIDQYPSLEKSVNKYQKTASQPTTKYDSSFCVSANNQSNLSSSTASSTKKTKLLSSIVGSSALTPLIAINPASSNNIIPAKNTVNHNNTPILNNTTTTSTNNMHIDFDMAVNNNKPVATNKSVVGGGAGNPQNHVNQNGGIVSSVNNDSSSNIRLSESELSFPNSSHSKVGGSSKAKGGRTNSSAAVDTQQSNRPAVIILNDERYNRLNEGEITFGFDIDSQLLFGDFEEEELQFLDSSLLAPDADTSKQLHHQLQHQQEQINTSDYNSYNSSNASSKGKGAAWNQDPDSNNNTSSDTVLHLLNNEEDLIVAKRQSSSTPKGSQQIVTNVLNCSNCSSVQTVTNRQLVNTQQEQEDSVCVSSGGSLMKNSCVQTSLDNLVLVNDCVGEKQPVLINGNGEVQDQVISIETIIDPPQDSAIIKMKKQLNIRYIEPNDDVFGAIWHNHEKIVNFVGLAWEDLTHNKSENVKYYNGQ